MKEHELLRILVGDHQHLLKEPEQSAYDYDLERLAAANLLIKELSKWLLK